MFLRCSHRDVLTSNKKLVKEKVIFVVIVLLERHDYDQHYCGAMLLTTHVSRRWKIHLLTSANCAGGSFMLIHKHTREKIPNIRYRGNQTREFDATKKSVDVRVSFTHSVLSYDRNIAYEKTRIVCGKEGMTRLIVRENILSHYPMCLHENEYIKMHKNKTY